MSRDLHRPAAAPTAAELVAAIVDAAAAACGVTAADIRSRRQTPRYAWARMAAQALAAEFTGETNAVIGTLFGLDPTTVSHAIRRIATAERDSPRVASQLADIRTAVEAQLPHARWRSLAELDRHRRLARVAGGGTAGGAEHQLDLMLRDLRRALMAALRTDPGRLLAGLARTAAEINDEEARCR